MNKRERIEQCKNNIAKLQENLKELEKPEILVARGDIVTCRHGKRIVLCDCSGRLSAFNKRGQWVGYIVPGNNYYKRTGDNIFSLPNNLDN